MNNSHPKFFLGALFGGALGVMTALLMTPASGAKVRNRLSRRLNTSILKPLKAGHAKTKKIIRRRKVLGKKHK